MRCDGNQHAQNRETALLRWVSELSGCRAVGLGSIKVYLLCLLRDDVHSASQNALENQHLIRG